MLGMHSFTHYLFPTSSSCDWFVACRFDVALSATGSVSLDRRETLTWRLSLWIGPSALPPAALCCLLAVRRRHNCALGRRVMPGDCRSPIKVRVAGANGTNRSGNSSALRIRWFLMMPPSRSALRMTATGSRPCHAIRPGAWRIRRKHCSDSGIDAAAAADQAAIRAQQGQRIRSWARVKVQSMGSSTVLRR